MSDHQPTVLQTADIPTSVPISGAASPPTPAAQPESSTAFDDGNILEISEKMDAGPGQMAQPAERLRLEAPVVLHDSQTKAGGAGHACCDTSLHIPLKSAGMMKLYVNWIPIFLSTFMTGYGFASMTAINTLPTYQAYFNLSGIGTSAGLVFALWPIAACCTFWIGPIVSDRFGRPRALSMCAGIFLIGSILLAFAQNYAMLLIGRAFCGAGVCIMQAASPAYIIETCPPLKRGLFSGLYNTMLMVGFCTAIAVGIGASRIQGQWGWRLVILIQLLVPIFIIASSPFLPQTPRWLYVDGQHEKALAFLQKYHGSGQITEVARIDYAQIAASVQAARDRGSKRWDFKNLARTRGNRYRLMLALVMGAFGQLSGSHLVFFFPQVLAQIGYTTAASRLSMSLIAYVACLLASVAGSLILDRVGRRKLLIIGTSACSVTLMGCMVSASQAGVPIGSTAPATNLSASRASIACFVIFNLAYGMSYQPLLPTYPGECLATEQRGTGMGLATLINNLSMVMCMFVIPVALERIGWWVYLPFTIWTLIEGITWYFIAVETKGRSLEELDAIFDSKHPVRASLVRTIRPTGDVKV